MKKFICVIFAAILFSVTLFGCGGVGNSNVKFWVYGDESELEIYTIMTEEFNEITNLLFRPFPPRKADPTSFCALRTTLKSGSIWVF